MGICAKENKMCWAPLIYIYIYIYIYIGSSYTFFKPLDLSRFNGKKNIIINVNILIDLIYYPLFNTFYT